LPIIETKGLTHTYSVGTPFELSAIKNIDFAAERGEFLGVIGHTGSGKSTFIQHLNGLLKPTAGKVLFDGKDIWSSKESIRQVRFKVGLVFQYPEYQLFEETVFRDIAFGPKNMGLSESEIEDRVRTAMRYVDLDESLMFKSPLEISGGQKRRAAIAGVLAMEPEVLVLDEPSAGLDPEGRENILSRIELYHEARGGTVIMVSHDMDEVAKYADRIVVLNGGKIEMEGTPAEVFSHAGRLEAIGLAVPPVTQVFIRLRDMGLPVDSCVYTLEQARDAILSLKGGRTGD
jgi:energy-coupling factor transport system ATP-binding protein